MGVHIHNFKNLAGEQSNKGKNPFLDLTLDGGTKRFSDVVRTYDPPYTESKAVYAHIRDHLAAWVDEAIAIRSHM